MRRKEKKKIVNREKNVRKGSGRDGKKKKEFRKRGRGRGVR